MPFPRGLDSIASKVFWSNNYGHEPEITRLFQSLLKDSRVIIDIGANTGFVSLLAVSYAPQSTIYAFEPVPDIYRLLKENIEANHFKYCVPILSAVSDHIGDESFYVPRVRPIPLSGSLDKRFYNDSHEIKVSSTTLDEFVKKHQIQNVDFVKIDVD